MNLRPELMPLKLDPTLIDRLTMLANQLDGVMLGQGIEELAEFNRLAGVNLTLADFQGIYRSEDPEDFVRRVLYSRSLTPDPNLSLAEMTEIIHRIRNLDDDDFYLELFEVNCKHPAGTDLIYYPDEISELPQDREPTSEEIARLALQIP